MLRHQEHKTNDTCILHISIDQCRTGTIFTDTDKGQEARTYYSLDYYDESKHEVVFLFPENTTSIKPSFFTGMFLKSYQALGKIEFERKYRFSFQYIIDAEVSRILRDELYDCIKLLEKSKVDVIQKIKRMFRFYNIFKLH